LLLLETTVKIHIKAFTDITQLIPNKGKLRQFNNYNIIIVYVAPNVLFKLKPE
jgi:hypothetical protein